MSNRLDEGEKMCMFSQILVQIITSLQHEIKITNNTDTNLFIKSFACIFVHYA